ncbi:MucR family transcriptional regulator [Frigidibacter sp. MR17.14]|uniref:MucR family transcriptional regulator n=1 Tax=Frigidibacter sp. MR17.14 TaxID=3126509 RepID=UPI003012BAE7
MGMTFLHRLGRYVGHWRSGWRSGTTDRVRPRPAVAVERSIAADHLVCLESGERVVLLGSHLARRFGLTPAEYRRRWGLPESYPMVAPAYEHRRHVAKTATDAARSDVLR